MKIELSQQELKEMFLLLRSPSISVKQTDNLQSKIIN